MTLRNSKRIGKFRPPEGSCHAKRSKWVFEGTCCDDGKPVRYYERTGQNVEISEKEWPKWTRVK